MTYKAQAYHIKCIYQTGEQNVTLGFNVSMLTTAGTIANTGPPPVCVMKIVAQNGNEINSAEIGDNLMLQVEVQPSSESFKANCSIRFSFSALYSLSSMNQCFKQLVKCCRLYGKKKKKKTIKTNTDATLQLFTVDSRATASPRLWRTIWRTSTW